MHFSCFHIGIEYSPRKGCLRNDTNRLSLILFWVRFLYRALYLSTVHGTGNALGLLCSSHGHFKKHDVVFSKK